MSSGWPKHIRLERSHCLPHLHALHNQTVIDGSFQAVMPDGLIGRALIPCLGRLEAREFRDHDALDGMALQKLKTAVVDEDLNLVTCEGCPDLVPINLQLRLIEGFLACKYQVSAHFSCSPEVVLLVAAVREDDFSREPARIIRGQKYGHARDVLGLAQAAQRRTGAHLLLKLRAHDARRVRTLRVGSTRTSTVNADLPAADPF